MTGPQQMTFIGLDPGVGGGIAFLSETGTVLYALKMPETFRDLLDILDEGFIAGRRSGQALKTPTFAMLERVNASPQMGVVSAFTFGRGYGALEMALVAARIPFDGIRPQKWQQALGCLTGGDKNVSKRTAQQLFPNEKITHAIADALLIAEYCRRIRTGTHVEEETRKVEKPRQVEGQRRRLAQSQAQGI